VHDVSEQPVHLRVGDKDVELPVVRGTENELGIDISKLRAETGMVTLDYGFMNTGSCESAITFIDGELGILRYRGVPIEQLVEGHQPSFLETAYLLIYGNLPNRDELDDFRYGIRKHTLLHEDAKRFFDAFPKDAHPMGVLASVVSALSTFYPDSTDPHDPEQVQLSIMRLMAKLPTIAAYAYKRSIGQPLLYPNNSLDLIENFLTMMFAVPSEPYEVSPIAVHAMKQLLILHADHAELLHLDCPTRRLERRQLVRLGVGGHQRAMGTTPRWRQPGRHRDARSRPRRRRQHREVRGQGEGPR